MGWREFIPEYWFHIDLIEVYCRIVHLEIIVFSFRRWECIRVFCNSKSALSIENQQLRLKV